MNTNETDIIESTNDTEETVNTEEGQVPEQETADNSQEIEELMKEVKTLKIQKDKWRDKANSKESSTETKSGDLSTSDLYILMDAKVPQEDVADVREYAKLKGVSIKEALESTMVKGLLAESAEQRMTASAANVGGAKGGSGKMTDEALLHKASNGQLPESHEDMMRIVRARQDKARKKN